MINVAFRPEGSGRDPQLAAGASGEPDELQLWHLRNGRKTKLSGHNSCIQARPRLEKPVRLLSACSKGVSSRPSASGHVLHS